MSPARCCPVCGQAVPVEAGVGAGAGAGPGPNPVPSIPEGSCPNRWCRRPGRAFSVVFSVGAYEGALRHAVWRYKYRGERHLASTFATMLLRYLAAHPTWFEEFTLITAVPSYCGPGARRSWDPVGTILSELGGRVGAGGRPRDGPPWSVEPGLIAKTAETPGMAGLGWRERQAVARGPLRRSLCPTVRLDGAQVLLLDDVMTEGGTVHEVAAALRRAGASDVAALVLARPVWAAEPPGQGPGPPGSPK